LIDRLKQRQQQLDSVMIYVSDHGESLGEKGLYLHGEPYVIAPDYQKHVPMLMWFSSDAPTRLGVDLSCMRGKLSQPFTHDYLAHTLLSVNDVVTTAYRPAFDLLSGCRTLASAAT
jgi:lipid A ethanolaminephosphotransferase